jgi:ATP-dependent helicase/nuclease subunit A
MANRLNEQQALAVTEFQSDLLVSAGAGTGKTSVLTSKYLRLLEERRAEVGEIVAITFTKKAAAEMSSRIQKSVREEAGLATDPETKEYWQTQLKKLENARISTFHSLCLNLIRQYPVEAGIPPAIEVMDEGEASLDIGEAINEVLTESIKGSDPELAQLPRVLSEYGWDNFGKSLGGLYQAIRESGNGFAAVIAQSLADCEAELTANPAQISQLINAVVELLEFAGTRKLTERAAELIGGLRGEWSDYQRVLESQPDLEEILTVFAALKKTLPKNLPNIVKERVVEIHELIEALSIKLADREMAGRFKLLEWLLEQVDRKYSAAKLEAGKLDFTDQQLLARDLLKRHPLLAEEVRRGIRYILVDEFQDTNGLQLEMIDLLAGTGYSGGRIMAVGDIKQSIYRFRGAEAGVILSLAERMKAGAGKIVPLTQNYRSNPLVISFINQFSRRLFAGEAFDYEALEAWRPDEDSRIECIYTGADCELKEQARTVARRIAQIVRKGRNDGNPVEYRDIVILFRAAKAMPLFQQALQELDIPCYAASGGAFYQRQEVVDQLNLLRLVHQRHDAVALFALLTSPYVGLTEESLFWLGNNRPLSEAFYAADGLCPEISVAEGERLENFRRVILFLQENRELFGISGIIRHALEQLDYREMLRTMSGPGQRLANLEKLLLKADEFGAKGYHDLTSFLQFIKKLESVEILENEAQTQAESSNVIRLMTIHRSKGLEFPIVILPDLDRKFRLGDDARFIYHKDVGVGFKIPRKDGDPEETSLWRRIRELEKREEISELKRLLYVAFTRAKHRLILVGSGVSKAKGDTLETASNWMKWLELLLPQAEADEPVTTLDYHGIPLQIIRKVAAADRPVPRETLLSHYASGFETPVLESEPEIAAARPLPPERINLKVTGILTFKECPRRFYLEHALRLPEVADRATAVPPGVPTDSLGARVGNFFHQLARWDGEIWPERLWENAFVDLERTQRERLRNDLQRMWVNFRRSEFAGPSGKRWEEVPFQLKLDAGVRVEGRFDRLLRLSDGKLVLVDYKTHRISGEQTGPVAARYFWQLQLYALAVQALWGCKPDRAALYFPYPDSTVTVPLDETVLAETVREVTAIGRFIREHDRMTDYIRKEICSGCVYAWFCGPAAGYGEKKAK